MPSEHDLVFSWWNTSLAPSAITRSTATEKLIACRIVIELITIVQADFIALGEMSEEDLVHISQVCAEFSYRVYPGFTRAGRSRFDTCYLVNTAKIDVIRTTDIVSTKSESTLKIAKRVEIASLVDGTVFHIFVSHWPSRMWCPENHADRQTYGLRLRDSVEELFAHYKECPYVIMLGDYNDEPFAQSLSDQVLASRDVELVRRKRTLLFNPFWRHLCSQPGAHSSAGSYFHAGGTLTKWRTFDQIIYSQAFLTSSRWAYREDSGLVYGPAPLMELITHPEFKFDHLPVYGRVKRNTEHG
nr:hypothetical protein [uncultured Pseudomonas sp.]